MGPCNNSSAAPARAVEWEQLQFLLNGADVSLFADFRVPLTPAAVLIPTVDAWEHFVGNFSLPAPLADLDGKGQADKPQGPSDFYREVCWGSSVMALSAYCVNRVREFRR